MAGKPMTQKEAVWYLTKEILKKFADFSVGGETHNVPGQTFCNYGDTYNVVGFRTNKEAKIQYQISYIISKNGNISSSVMICPKDTEQEPEKKRIYFYKADESRTDVQNGILKAIEAFIKDKNQIAMGKILESK